MNTQLSTFEEKSIHNKIYTIRGKQVMLDHDLASVYGVETKIFNQAVKRKRAIIYPLNST